MPLDKGFYGTNADGSETQEYCKFCYVAGAFVEPALTLDDMLKKSISHMTRVLRLTPEKAKQAAHEMIPNLKRWKKE